MNIQNSNFFANIGYDVVFALIFSFIVLPLCFGIVRVSGSPFFSGIVASIIGGVSNGSQLSIIGPVAQSAGINAIETTDME